MNQKVLRPFAADYLPKLSQRPGCRGMRSDIDVRYASASDLHDHKHVQHAADCFGFSCRAGGQVGMSSLENFCTEPGGRSTDTFFESDDW